MVVFSEILRNESVASSGAEIQANVVESDDSETSSKADILVRMAKIGQNLLPPSVGHIVSQKQQIEEDAHLPIADVQKPVVPPRHAHELAIVCADLTLARCKT